ncbi:hypothetical protein B0H16DRAFT_1530095 [Mycena metata]|uniref:DUF6729 domain-containing protein n=1 Tax=Mycena metata TaxID=1033252 RepID=A0AAD7NJ18_9AGAR|nr:hypothetical protein B0H16DRAFT_1530095 [Mycena metata]
MVAKSRHYLAGTFWLPRKPAWFALGRLNVKPTDLFLPDFFLWDPMSLLGGAAGIVCPDCNSHHLTRDGVVERPRRVVDVDACFWILGYTYACLRCPLSVLGSTGPQETTSSARSRISGPSDLAEWVVDSSIWHSSVMFSAWDGCRGGGRSFPNAAPPPIRRNSTPIFAHKSQADEPSGENI